MALKLTLRSGERMILGGAVLRNDGADAHLSVENSVPVLRGKDILGQADAITPSRRIYFNIQLMYVDESHLPEQLQLHWQLSHELVTAVPRMASLLDEIHELIAQRDYYRALKVCKRLVVLEDELTGRVPAAAQHV